MAWLGRVAHPAETFRLSPDPPLIPGGRDIVVFYLNPPDQAVVAPRGRTIADSGARSYRAVAADAPWRAKQRTDDCKRHGTSSLFAAFDRHGARGDPLAPPQKLRQSSC